MKTLRLILALLLLSGCAWATAYTANTTGNWNSSTTWSGAGIPGAGDTATINNGITVTVPSSYVATIGADSGTDGLSNCALQGQTTAGTGVLALAANSTFIYRGTICQPSATWTAAQGAQIVHAGIAAQYSWIIGSTNYDAALLQLTGVSGNRVIIRQATAGDGYFGALASRGFTSYNGSTDLLSSGDINWSYVTVSGCGTSSSTYPCVRWRPYVTADQLVMSYVNMTGSGSIYFQVAPPAGSNISITNSTLTGTIDANGRQIAFTSLSTAPTTGTRALNYNVIQGLYLAGSAIAFAPTGNVFYNNTNGGSSAFALDIQGPMSMDLNMVYDSNTTAATSDYLPLGGAITRLIALRLSTAGNTYFFQQNAPTAQTIINGCLWEKNGTDTTGVFLTPSNASISLQNTTVEYCVGLPNYANQDNAGSLLQPAFSGGDAYNTFTTNHNTLVSASTTGVFRQGGSNTGTAGLLTVAENNIVWRPTSAAGLVVGSTTASIVTGAFTNVDYNNEYNLTGSVYQYSPGAYASPSPPGPHDQQVNPHFVDTTRNFQKWCTNINSSDTTWPECIAEFLNMNNDSGHNAAFTLLSLYTWVRAGYQIQNSLLHNAGSDGADIGAMPYASTATPNAFWFGIP